MEESKYLKRSALRGRDACTLAFIAMLAVLNIRDISAQTAVASNSGPICTGGTVMLYETGGSAVSWQWSSSGAAVFNDRNLQNPTATGVTDGEIFTVQITDTGGSTASANTTVTVFQAIPARPGLVTGDEAVCYNATGLVYSISHSFGAPADVYGGNLRLSADGRYLILGGDANQNGTVDTGDYSPVVNDASRYTRGYIYSDIDGNGSVDTGDYSIMVNNATRYVRTIHP